MKPHGFVRYTKGCRCQLCTSGNRWYHYARNRRLGKKERGPRGFDSTVKRCKICKRRSQRERARRSGEYIRMRRQGLGPCAHCGSTERLEFDHIDASTKTINVSRMQGWSVERIEKEIAKCQVLCKACHVAKTVKNKEHAF